MLFHTTLSMGRSDTFYLESLSKNKLLSFLKSVSVAVVRNIKQVVYSKAFNINYVHQEYISTPTYHRVVVFALSEKYAKTFELYHVKKSITEDELKIQLKKLFINDEPIIDFFDIQFYNEGFSPTSYHNLYQIQYKRDSKTFTEDFHSDSWEKVKDYAESVIGGELTEIRKYVHYDSTIKKDNGDYIKSIHVNVSDDEAFTKVTIPKIKKNVDSNEFKQLYKNSILFKTKPLTNQKFTLSYR